MDFDDAWAEVSVLERGLRRILNEHFGSDAELATRHVELAAKMRSRKDSDRSAASGGLLAYAELRELATLIETEWGAGLSSRFARRQRTIKSDLNRIADLRNTPAHSRFQPYFDRALLVGLCGTMSNEILMSTGERDPNDDYYPVITSAHDMFGQTSMSLLTKSPEVLHVGDVIRFDLEGRDARGRELHWKLTLAARPTWRSKRAPRPSR